MNADELNRLAKDVDEMWCCCPAWEHRQPNQCVPRECATCRKAIGISRPTEEKMKQVNIKLLCYECFVEAVKAASSAGHPLNYGGVLTPLDEEKPE